MEREATLQINGRNLEVKVTTREDRERLMRGRGSYARIYVWMPSPEELGGETHPEYTRKGDAPEIDKAWRRYNRIEKDNMREVLETVFPELNQGELRHSRKAGCSCGCSPGWLVRQYWPEVRWYEDVFVNVTEVVTPEDAALAAFLVDATAHGAVV